MPSRKSRSGQSPLSQLLRSIPRGQLALILCLMLLSSLTEGAGIMMIVPMLATLGLGGSGLSTRIMGIFTQFGLPHTLGAMLVLFVALVSMRAILVFAQSILSEALQYETIDALRRRCFSALLGAEWRWLSHHRSSDHANALLTNILRIGVGLHQIMLLMATAMAAAAYLAAAIFISWKAALAALCGGACVLMAFTKHRRKALRLGEKMGEVNRAMQAEVQEGLAGVRLTKILGNEARQASRFSHSIGQVRTQRAAFARSSGYGQMALQMGGATVLALLLYWGLGVWHLPIAALFPLILIFTRLIPMLSSAQQNWHYWLNSAPALQECLALITAANIAAEPADDPQIVVDFTDSIHLKSVDLSYASREKMALSGINLSIAARTTLAIIGASGSGKSTLADVIMGLITPDSGQLCVDGINITGPLRQAWRKKVAYVQQDSFLFHDTIRANLLWAKADASDSELQRALTSASAQFVSALPEGLDTVVGDGGSRLSGGERQRIALARALLGNPSLLILDEATSALDLANETQVRQAIHQLHGNLTIIIIGHRLALLKEADQIITLENGQIIPNSPTLLGAG